MKVNDVLLAKYTLKTSEYRGEQHTKPDHWSYTKCEILMDGQVIGEYIHNYRGTGAFHPFERDGKHYALYSKNYTATRVMSLPDCQDLGGEEPDSFGFCPVEYAVPYEEYSMQENSEDPADPEPQDNPRNDTKKWVQVIDRQYLRPGDAGYTLLYTKDEYEAAVAEWDQRNRAWDTRHPWGTYRTNGEFGFIAGCIWGDDTSWKIQHLDLSRVAEGIIVRSARFGYIEKLSGMPLKDAISFHWYYPPDEPVIQIACMQGFNLRKDYGKTRKDSQDQAAV